MPAVEGNRGGKVPKIVIIPEDMIYVAVTKPLVKLRRPFHGGNDDKMLPPASKRFNTGTGSKTGRESSEKGESDAETLAGSTAKEDVFKLN